jgi:hypothetical protein
MAIDSVDQALVRQFSDKIHMQAQQMVTRLKPYVEVKSIIGDDFAYDGLNSVEAKEIYGRVVPVEFSDIDHKRRKMSRRRFTISLPIDSSDIRGVIQDLAGNYSFAIAKGLMRKVDKVIYDALFATVSTGREFGTDVTAANDGVATVDATAGLTYEKLLEIKKNFSNDEVGNDMDQEIILGISGDEEEQLFKETELTSGDFTRNYFIDKGRMINALGMKLVTFGGDVASPIIDVVSGVRNCFAMAKGGVCLGISKDINIEIYDDKRYYETTVIQGTMEIGAVRTEGALVQKLTATPS